MAVFSICNRKGIMAAVPINPEQQSGASGSWSPEANTDVVNVQYPHPTG
jgi:hypothetical protein